MSEKNHTEFKEQLKYDSPKIHEPHVLHDLHTLKLQGDQPFEIEIETMRKNFANHFNNLAKQMDKFLLNLGSWMRKRLEEENRKLKDTQELSKKPTIFRLEEDLQELKDKTESIKNRAVSRMEKECLTLEKNRTPSQLPTVSKNGDKFYYKQDLSRFKPENIKVKVDSRAITIQAKHEEKGKAGELQSGFFQQVPLPKDVSGSRLKSKISANGLLIIEEVAT